MLRIHDSHLSSFVVAAAAALTLGCAGAGGADESPLDAPIILGVGADTISVGGDLEIYGGNFVNGSAGHTEVEFIGQYHTDSGAVHDVSLRMQPHWEDGNRMVWAFFGPFAVPFSPTGDELGKFVGDIVAVNVDDDTGAELRSEPAPIELEVEPSIVITGLAPVDAECDKLSDILLAGFPYKISAKALGFDPVNFSFVIAGEPTSIGPRIYRQQVVGDNATFGDDGELVFERTPPNVPFYLATLAVTATDTEGNDHYLVLDFGVHNPIEFIHLNTFEIAEIETAVPVSGCIAGGETNGRKVTYTEQETDTRSRTVGINWNNEFFNQQTGTISTSSSETNSINVSVNESTTQGAEFGWEDGRDISGGGSAGGSLFGIVEVGVSGEYKDIHREHASWNRSNTRGYTVGRNYSRTDTESWAFSATSGHRVSQGGSDFWTISSSETTIVSYEGFILPGQFGVFYRQTTRIALPGLVVAYNMCGVPEVVGETNFYDYIWSVDLATGSECPPFPESSLPDAQCFRAPCEGQ